MRGARLAPVDEEVSDLRRHLTLTDGFSARTHVCPHCKLVLGRDHNAARNILALGVRRLEHTTAGHAEIHACGQ